MLVSVLGHLFFTLHAYKIVQKLLNITMFFSKIFNVAFLILFSLKNNVDMTPAEL